MVVELEQMASRPFASVSAEIEPKIDPYNGPGALAMKREPLDVKRKKVRVSAKQQVNMPYIHVGFTAVFCIHQEYFHSCDY